MCKAKRWWTGVVLAAVMTWFGVAGAWAQEVEASVPISQRKTINLAAGMPNYIADQADTTSNTQSQWLFQNTANSTLYESQTFVESSDGAARWQPVGLPYDANITRTFLNQTSGGG